MDESITQDEMDDLRNYILKAQGISRNEINSMALIGIFIFGWLIADVLNCLGKSIFGGVCNILLYLLISLTRISSVANEPALRLSVQLGWLIYIAIYVGAWIYANGSLSHYQSAARQRIAEIESQGEVGIDMVLEKGLLLYKVFQEKQAAVDVLCRALPMSDGDAQFLNIAGSLCPIISDIMMLPRFDRATASTKDESLLKQIKKNRSSIKISPTSRLVSSPLVHLCPKCGTPMMITTETEGENLGKRFYICPNYNKCRQLIPAE